MVTPVKPTVPYNPSVGGIGTGNEIPPEVYAALIPGNPMVRTNALVTDNPNPAAARSGLPIFNGGPTRDYIASTKALAQAQPELGRIIEEQMGVLSGATADAKGAAALEAEGAREAELAKFARVDQNQAQLGAVFAALGMDANDPTSFVTRSGKFMKDIEPELTARRAAITKKQAVGFFDNPLLYILNQMALPGEIAEFNGLANEYNSQMAQMAQKTAEVNNRQTAIKAAQPVDSALEVAGRVKRIVADAESKAAVADANLALQNMQAAGQYFTSLVQVNNAQAGMSSAQYQAAHARFASIVDDIKWRESAPQREAAKLQLEKLKEEMDQMKAIGPTLRMAETQLGLPPGTINEKFFYSRPVEMQQELLRVGLHQSFGKTWQQAYSTMQQFQPADPVSRAWMQFYGDAISEASSANNVLKETDPKKAQAQLEKEVKRILDRKFAAPAPGTLFYEQPPKATLNKLGAEWQAHPIGKVLSTLPDNVRTEQVVNTIWDIGVQSGLNSQQLTDVIHNYYKASLDDRDRQLNYGRFGVSAPKGYKQMLPNASFFGGDMAVDLRNRADVERYVIQRSSAATKFGQATAQALSSSGNAAYSLPKTVIDTATAVVTQPDKLFGVGDKAIQPFLGAQR